MLKQQITHTFQIIKIMSFTNTINNIVSKDIHFEFEILGLTNNDLVLIGSEDFCYYHTLEITFQNIFHINLNESFKIDTTKPFLSLPEKQEAYDLNVKLEVLEGYYIFKLTTEGIDDAITFYVIAQDIKYNTDTVFYYKRENLKENERIAEWVLNKPDSSDMTK